LVRRGNELEALQEEQRRMDTDDWEEDEYEQNLP
jgi:hypothetical protein